MAESKYEPTSVSIIFTIRVLVHMKGESEREEFTHFGLKGNPSKRIKVKADL